MDSLATVTGTRMILNNQLTGQTTGTFVSDSTVTGPKTFEGISAIEVKVVSTADVSGVGSGTTDVFNYIGVSGLTAYSYGATTQVGSGMAAVTNKTVFSPPVQFRYDLAPGESFIQEYASTATLTYAIPGVPPNVTTVNTRQKVTFVGVEQITVPAGTFNACKFSIENTDVTPGGSGGTSVATNWVAVGSGVSLRNESPVQGSSTVNVTALTSGSINGVPVTP